MAKKLRPLEPRDLALVADLELEGAWRVEYFDSDGAGYVAIFAGRSAVCERATTMMRSSAAPSRLALPTPGRGSKESRLVPAEKMAASSLRRRRFQFGQGSLHSVQDNGTGRIEVAE